MAIERLKGTAMIVAKIVTEIDATINGKTPNLSYSLVGYQLNPKIKSVGLTSLKIGKPSLKRNNIISNRIKIQKKAIMKNNCLVVRSTIFWLEYFFLK